MPREPPTLSLSRSPSFTLCIPCLSLSLSLLGTPLYPFPSVKPFPVKSGGQLTVRIRTRSACIIYFQRALPSLKRAGWNTACRPFQIRLSELRVTCCAFVPLSPHLDEERITIRVLPIYRDAPSPNRSLPALTSRVVVVVVARNISLLENFPRFRSNSLLPIEVKRNW